MTPPVPHSRSNHYPLSLTDRFYLRRNNRPFWFVNTADRAFTTVALTLAADCWRGRTDGVLRYDGVSPLFADREDSFLLTGLNAISPDTIDCWLKSLNPKTIRFEVLRKALAQSLDSANQKQVSRISATLNMFRFVHHFAFPRFIIVNIPSAMLYYYSADTLTLQMRVVAILLAWIVTTCRQPQHPTNVRAAQREKTAGNFILAGN